MRILLNFESKTDLLQVEGRLLWDGVQTRIVVRRILFVSKTVGSKHGISSLRTQNWFTDRCPDPDLRDGSGNAPETVAEAESSMHVLVFSSTRDTNFPSSCSSPPLPLPPTTTTTSMTRRSSTNCRSGGTSASSLSATTSSILRNRSDSPGSVDPYDCSDPRIRIPCSILLRSGSKLLDQVRRIRHPPFRSGSNPRSSRSASWRRPWRPRCRRCRDVCLVAKKSFNLRRMRSSFPFSCHFSKGNFVQK